MLLHNWNQELFDFLYATLLFDIHKPEKAVYLLKQTSFACATFLKRYIEMTLSGMDSKKKEALLYVFYGEKSITWLKHLEAGNAFALLQEYCQHSGLLKKTTQTQIKRNGSKMNYIKKSNLLHKEPKLIKTAYRVCWKALTAPDCYE